MKPSELLIPPGSRGGELILAPVSEPAKAGDIPVDRGTLIVLENRGDPGSRLIALPVIRFPAGEQRSVEPIFFLAGGPGRSNLGFKMK